MLRHRLLFLAQLVIISRRRLFGLLKDLLLLILMLIWMLGGTQFILANNRLNLLMRSQEYLTKDAAGEISLFIPSRRSMSRCWGRDGGEEAELAVGTVVEAAREAGSRTHRSIAEPRAITAWMGAARPSLSTPPPCSSLPSRYCLLFP